MNALFFQLQRYRNYDITVNKKDGLVLVREMAAEVKNMMDFKMNAVMVRSPRILPPQSHPTLCPAFKFEIKIPQCFGNDYIFNTREIPRAHQPLIKIRHF